MARIYQPILFSLFLATGFSTCGAEDQVRASPTNALTGSNFIGLVETPFMDDIAHEQKNLTFVLGEDVQVGDFDRRIGRFRHGAEIRFAKVTPDGSSLIVAGGKLTKIWNLKTGELVHILKHDQAVTAAALSPNGSCLVTCHQDWNSFIWTLPSAGLRRQMKHDGLIVLTRFSHNGKVLAMATESSLQTWDPENGERLAPALHGLDIRPRRYQTNLNQAICFDPGDTQIAAIGGNGVKLAPVRAWPKQGREWIAVVPHGQSGPVNSVDFSMDGKVLLTSSFGSVASWDVATGKRRHVFVDSGYMVGSAEYINGDELVLMTGQGGLTGLVSTKSLTQIIHIRNADENLVPLARAFEERRVFLIVYPGAERSQLYRIPTTHATK